MSMAVHTRPQPSRAIGSQIGSHDRTGPVFHWRAAGFRDGPHMAQNGWLEEALCWTCLQFNGLSRSSRGGASEA